MPFYLFEWSMNWKIKTLSDPFKIPTRNICMCTGVLLFYFLTLRSIFWVFVLASFSSSCFIFSSFVLSYFIFRENKVFNVLFWLMFNTIACVYKFCLFAICFLWEYFLFLIVYESYETSIKDIIDVLIQIVGTTRFVRSAKFSVVKPN